MKRAVLITLAVVFTVCVPAARAQSVPRKDIPAIAKAANGSVVTIVMGDNNKPVALGTGFIVSPSGLVVTNYHVIKAGSVAAVKFPDGTILPADGLVAADKNRDVAVIKIHGKPFRALTLGNSDSVQIGEEVVAIGNPLGLELTISNGIVSGIRTVEKEGGKFLQVTAPISHGSSGGPLLNMTGEVIGITSMYFEGGENLNFAIPINEAKRLLLNLSAKLQNLPNEQPDENATSAEGNDNSDKGNDDSLMAFDTEEGLRKQIDWMRTTKAHRDVNSSELRETLQWIKNTLPEGSLVCTQYSEVGDVPCFKAELSTIAGCVVELGQTLSFPLKDELHPMYKNYFDLGNLDPERISSLNLHDLNHEYKQLFLYTRNDENKILVNEGTHDLHNKLKFFVNADYGVKLEKALRQAIGLCGGKPSSLKF